MNQLRPITIFAVLICVGSAVVPSEVLGQQQKPYQLGPAKLSEIKIFRQKAGGLSQEIIPVNFEAIKKNRIPDVFLQPYDVIEVYDSGPFESGGWWKFLVAAFTGGIRSTVVPLPVP
jgi:hypothetical protein